MNILFIFLYTLYNTIMNLISVVLLLMNQLVPTELAPVDAAPVRIGLALSGGAALGLVIFTKNL